MRGINEEAFLPCLHVVHGPDKAKSYGLSAYGSTVENHCIPLWYFHTGPDLNYLRTMEIPGYL